MKLVMSKKKVLGLDSGPSLVGWAVVDVALGSQGIFLAGGHDTPDFVAGLMGTVDRVVIECPMGTIYSGVRAKQLFRTAEVAGWLRAKAEMAEREVVEVSAEEWRRGLLGKSSPTDAEIAQALKFQVPGLEHVSAHVRDAAGAAYACAHGVLGTSWRHLEEAKAKQRVKTNMTASKKAVRS